MTTHEEDQPEPPIVGETCVEAQRIIQKLTALLQFDGWDSIVISLTRRVDADGFAYAPGATATVISRDRVGPIIPQITEVLRKQASMLEKQWGDEDVGTGYIQDQTDYSSGCAEWPR